MAASPGGRRDLLEYRDDRTRGRWLRPEADAQHRGARRRRLGDRRPQVVRVVGRSLVGDDGAGQDRPDRPAAPAVLRLPGADRHLRLHGGAAHPDDGRPHQQIRRDPPRPRTGTGQRAARRAGRRVPDRPDAPTARPGVRLHAVARSGRTRLRTDVRLGQHPSRPRLAAPRQR